MEKNYLSQQGGGQQDEQRKAGVVGGMRAGDGFSWLILDCGGGGVGHICLHQQGFLCAVGTIRGVGAEGVTAQVLQHTSCY